MEKDRRKEPRYQIRQLVSYDMGRAQYLQAQAIDISEHGIGFISNECVEPNMAISLLISIPDGLGSSHLIEVHGFVVHVTEMPDGCRFSVSMARMTPTDRELFQAWIAGFEAKA